MVDGTELTPEAAERYLATYGIKPENFRVKSQLSGHGNHMISALVRKAMGSNEPLGELYANVRQEDTGQRIEQEVIDAINQDAAHIASQMTNSKAE